MRINRAELVVIFFTVIFVSFSAGFLGGRMTAGNTFTIATEIQRGTQGIQGAQGTQVPQGIVAPSEAPSGESPSGSPSPSVVDKAPESADAGEVFPININTAGVDGLVLLPSIGETRARAIISHREKNGPFRSVADIMEVTGIGSGVYDKLKEYITVD